MEAKEELLIQKAQLGNLAAFEELVRRYDSKVMQLLFSLLNNFEDTQDVYQHKIYSEANRGAMENWLGTEIGLISLGGFGNIVNLIFCLTFKKN